MRDFGQANFEKAQRYLREILGSETCQLTYKALGVLGSTPGPIYLDLRCHTFSITKEDMIQTSQFFGIQIGLILQQMVTSNH